MSYSNYFGLKEASFSITPDPQYLFLSEQHREALAHLLYGARESGGFVLLTGEVGTGKTTVCRAFLEQLPEDVEVALILNPAMTVTELLRAACDELHIQVPEKENSVKSLVDRLNDYLLKAHAQGRRAVLMIDEAQDLRPKVLEQIRLLTNLETTKHKLLQIFLVGQPELRTLLQREGLRQLDQRITARYHLRPFNMAETGEYVRHRLAVAGVERPLFTRTAMRELHRLSGGVPRLINILCDRSLLGAYVTRSPLVTKLIVRKAAHEVQDRGPGPKQSRSRVGRVALVAAFLVLAVLLGWITRDWLVGPPFAQIEPYIPSFLANWLPLRPADPITDSADSGPHSRTDEEQAEPIPGLAPAGPEDEPPLTDFALDKMTMDQASAMRLLLRRWDVELEDLGPKEPCDRVRDFGLRCEAAQGDWEEMRFFGRPALIELTAEDGEKRYAVIRALDSETATLDLEEGNRRVTLASLDEYWDGEYLMLWQPPPVGRGIIGPGSSGDSVRWLRKLLSQIPDLDLKATTSGTFDRALEDAVHRFQEQEGLKSDGVAGPKTLIRIHNAVGMPEIPRLAPTP